MKLSNDPAHQGLTHGVTRRTFMKQTAVTALLMPACSLCIQRAAEALTVLDANYYLAHKLELTKAFRETLEGARQFWTPEFGATKTDQMVQLALSHFETLLPNLPDVGGEKNWDTQFLPIAAWYVSLYRPMKEHGKTAEDVGKLVYELNLIGLKSMTKEEATTEQHRMFSREQRDKMMKWADWTQKRQYPANWVARFVPGDGKDFDFGYDYSECGLVKFFTSQGVSELAPYVCLNDFSNSASIGSGLYRTKTIAQGDDVCNFRYKRGRRVVQNWSTEIALIRSRVSQA